MPRLEEEAREHAEQEFLQGRKGKGKVLANGFSSESGYTEYFSLVELKKSRAILVFEDMIGRIRFPRTPIREKIFIPTMRIGKTR